MERAICYLNIRAFSVEVQRASQPKLQHRPVVVANSTHPRALVLSASAEAQQEGIWKGLAVAQAQKFCPQLVVLPPQPELENKMVRHLNERVYGLFTPTFEVGRPGHLYLDFTQTQRLHGGIENAAFKLQTEIKQQLGLPSTVGAATNKLVSRIAAKLTPNHQLQLVAAGNEANFLKPHSPILLPGIGEVKQRRLLEELNIRTIEEISKISVGQLRWIFGSKAALIHQAAVGIDTSPIYTPRRALTIEKEITLPHEETDDDLLWGALLILAEECTGQLQQQKMHTQVLKLGVRYSDQVVYYGVQKLSKPCQQLSELKIVLRSLFHTTLLRRIRVRWLQLICESLSTASPQLEWIWSSEGTQNVSLLPANEKLADSLQHIRQRFGSHSLSAASTFYWRQK